MSYRSALENLLNAIGGDLDVPLVATHELADTGDGAGRPDFGMFEKKSGNPRCVVEVKAPTAHVPETADGAQVTRYWQRYRYVLVTNYRDFLLVVHDPKANGGPRVEARYSLTPTAEARWRTPAKALAKEHEIGLADPLTGVLLRPAPITKPKDLAADLARHAREAKRRLQHHPHDSLKPLQESFEQSLGLQFDDKDHRRLPGHQEVAELPREARPRPPAAHGGDDLHHRSRATAQGPAAAWAGTG
jgi:hypothetical protein